MKKLLLVILLFASFAKASSCLKNDTIILGAERVSQSCRLSGPLELVKSYFYYPNISINEMNIEYWKGSYERENLYQVHYQQIVTNVCTQKEVSRKNLNMIDRDFDEFKIENPNLDFNISESYKLAPLTRAEADATFVKLKADCENSMTLSKTLVHD